MKNFAFSLKAVAVAMGMMGIAQCASAAILTNEPSSGNGSFLFVAVDDANKSWIQGINFTLDDSVGTTQQSFNLTGLKAFFAGSTSAVWGVVAGDAAGLGGDFNGYRMAYSLATSNTETLVAEGKGTSQQNVANAALKFQGWLGAFGGGRTPNAPLTSTLETDIYNVGNDDDSIGLNLFLQGPSYATGLVDGSELTNWIFDNGPDEVESYLPSSFAKRSNWRLNLNSDQLVYAPAPAPVPVPAALWLLGSALVGVTGIRRRA